FAPRGRCIMLPPFPWFDVVIILALVALNGVFAMSELAIVSSRKARLEAMARAGKRGGAWMAQARPRLRDGNQMRVPVAYLVCNFAPKGADQPSLLSHNDVVTLLHETGHCLHHLFTRVDRP
ncbi:hypothetical protein DKP78_16195, partial [Enterococcus faecium]